MNNWTGNKKSIYVTLGASNHVPDERAKHDYYATEPKATEILLDELRPMNVLEPACGEGHISRVLMSHGISVASSDLINRGFGVQRDFFTYDFWDGDIVTNPPYKYAQAFVEHALKIIPMDRKVCMFLKLQFLEGKKRKKLFTEFPPWRVYVSSSRLLCAKNGKFAPIVNGKWVATKGHISSSAVAYAWFVWIKGMQTQTVIEWVN